MSFRSHFDENVTPVNTSLIQTQKPSPSIEDVDMKKNLEEIGAYLRQIEGAYPDGSWSLDLMGNMQYLVEELQVNGGTVEKALVGRIAKLLGPAHEVVDVRVFNCVVRCLKAAFYALDSENEKLEILDQCLRMYTVQKFSKKFSEFQKEWASLKNRVTSPAGPAELNNSRTAEMTTDFAWLSILDVECVLWDSFILAINQKAALQLIVEIFRTLIPIGKVSKKPEENDLYVIYVFQRLLVVGNEKIDWNSAECVDGYVQLVCKLGRTSAKKARPPLIHPNHVIQRLVIPGLAKPPYRLTTAQVLIKMVANGATKILYNSHKKEEEEESPGTSQVGEGEVKVKRVDLGALLVSVAGYYEAERTTESDRPPTSELLESLLDAVKLLSTEYGKKMLWMDGDMTRSFVDELLLSVIRWETKFVITDSMPIEFLAATQYKPQVLECLLRRCDCHTQAMYQAIPCTCEEHEAHAQCVIQGFLELVTLDTGEKGLWFIQSGGMDIGDLDNCHVWAKEMAPFLPRWREEHIMGIRKIMAAVRINREMQGEDGRMMMREIGSFERMIPMLVLGDSVLLGVEEKLWPERGTTEGVIARFSNMADRSFIKAVNSAVKKWEAPEGSIGRVIIEMVEILKKLGQAYKSNLAQKEAPRALHVLAKNLGDIRREVAITASWKKRQGKAK